MAKQLKSNIYQPKPKRKIGRHSKTKNKHKR